MNDVEPDDRHTMADVARGSREALATLYGRYRHVAYAFALRAVGDSGLAEEIVQDAFVTLWRHAPGYDARRSSPRTWIMTLVRTRAIDALRRRGRIPISAPMDARQPNAIGDDPWPEYWKSHCGAAVRKALADLAPEQRIVIELGFFFGLSHSEIALRLHKPLGTIKKRMRSGLQRMRVALDSAFEESVTR